MLSVLIVTKQLMPDPATMMGPRLQLVRVVGAWVIVIGTAGDVLAL